MWPSWLKSPKRVHPKTPKSFRCTSFKDIDTILQPEPDLKSPRSPTIFHRVRISASLLRWAHIKPHSSTTTPVASHPSQGVVVYYTSLRIVRKTYQECKTVRSILRGYRVPIDERDLSMDIQFLDELQAIMGDKKTKVSLPKVFIGGKYIGGADEIQHLHETGELKRLIDRIPKVGPPASCDACGGMRFLVCEVCNGSHKIYMEKHGFRICGVCDVNGLIRCPACYYENRRSTESWL